MAGVFQLMVKSMCEHVLGLSRLIRGANQSQFGQSYIKYVSI